MTDIHSQTSVLMQAQAASQNKQGNISQQKARAAAEDFEAFFLSQMLNTMSAGIQTDETFGGGESEKIFRSMLNDEYSKSMARQGGIGIADAVFREMLAMQEV
ncbi:MAG: rod-binding protein [Sneathiellales bacterium]|nr:rod-binding protein [Sneathiellales bacterium]